jgi:SpoVK/Ycf46/Vps4 family AAA+-type ATPase
MPSGSFPPEIPFEQLTAQLAQAATELAPVEASERNASAPVATLRKGQLCVELSFEQFPAESFLAALPVLDRYMRSMTELKHGYQGCSLLADVLTSRVRSSQPDLPKPLRVVFRFASKLSPQGELKFEREGQLCQEEINCILELWRTFLRKPPKAALPDALPYDEMLAQLEQAAARELAQVPLSQRAGAAPVATLHQGKVTIEIATQVLPQDMLLGVLNLVSKHSRSFSEVHVYPSSFSVLVHFQPPGDRPLAKSGRNEGVRITLQFDARRKIQFEKANLLLQEELLCVLEVWRKVTLRQVEEQARTGSPGVLLAELGAVVFEPGGELPELAGYEATQRDVRETVVMPLLHRELYVQVARLTRGQERPSLPRAVLFEGPPGTGKTTMARKIASEAGLPLVYVPVESVMSKWYGESERRLDTIFDLAGTYERSIVFLDEIDAFAGSRAGSMHEATRRVLSVLLRQLQGLVDTTHVMVIGATNRMDDLDPALLNRFARTIRFPLPDHAERCAIVARYAKHLEAGEVARVAGLAGGASGRVIEDLCGTAERLWIGRWLLAPQPGALPAPPVAVYEEAFGAWSQRADPGVVTSSQT